MEVSFYLPTTVAMMYALGVIMALVFLWLAVRVVVLGRSLSRFEERLHMHSDVLGHHAKSISELQPKKASKRKAPAKKRAPAKKAAPKVADTTNEPAVGMGTSLSDRMASAFDDSRPDIVDPSDL